jgi:hypothetical protein
MIAALFVRPDSHYKGIPGVDAYDQDRDALTWPGGCPGIFHPPCRTWSRLSHFVKDAPDFEQSLGLWSMAMVRRFGGVVEHPKDSKLWAAAGCLTPGLRDAHGGILVTLEQGWYGHRAPKATALYIVGAPVPDIPLLATVSQDHRIERMGRAERERTPPVFAALLVHLARQALPWSMALEVAA